MQSEIERLKKENKELELKCNALECTLASFKAMHESMVAEKAVPPWLRKP